MERVDRDAAPGLNRPLVLHAARGEYESFQLVIRPPAEGLTGVRVQVGDLLGPNATRIASSNVTVFREHYVFVSTSSPDRGGANRPLGVGWYPDALVPLAASHGSSKFDVVGSKNQPVWIDIFVPPDAVPGLYRGAVTLSTSQGQVVEEVSLQVWDFVLPSTPSLNSLFIASNDTSLNSRIELLKHKLMPGVLNRQTNTPVGLPEERMLSQEWGLKSANLAFWSGADISHCEMAPAPSLEAVRRARDQHSSGLHVYNFTADEIDNCVGLRPRLEAWAKVLHQAGVDNLVTVMPRPELEDDGTGRSLVDIWVVLPSMYDSAPERISRVLQNGNQVWSYNALVQDDYSPKWQIDFAPINYRIQPGFMSQSLGLTGLLYWQIDRWTEDPWKNVQTYSENDEEYPGEGMLVYPGNDLGINGIVPSMRLKWLRDGVEDYEYIAILKRHGCGDFGLKVARSLARSWKEWTHDPQKLERERERLGTFVARVVKSEQRCPEVAGLP